MTIGVIVQSQLGANPSGRGPPSSCLPSSMPGRTGQVWGRSSPVLGGGHWVGVHRRSQLSPRSHRQSSGFAQTQLQHPVALRASSTTFPRDPPHEFGMYWGKRKELWPALDSKCCRQQGDPLPGDTVADSKATLAPHLTPGFTQTLHNHALLTPHAYDSQLP